MLNAQHLKMVQSLTLNDAYIQLKPLPSLVPELFIAVFLFFYEKAKLMEPYEETCYLWTRSEIRFRFT